MRLSDIALPLRRPILKRLAMATAALAVVSGIALAWLTAAALRPVPDSFYDVVSDSYALQVLDRHGTPLNVTYQNRWNVHDVVPLHEVPELLRAAFVISEDKRFYRHGGVDWLARMAALASNLRNARKVRGASTITEQVVRMLNPRPRTVWSRWLEGWEAADLEERFSKDEILEFYLNQIPYAANRRGIVQAARYYFNRDLDTLDAREMLALAILVRAPSRFDLYRAPGSIDGAVQRLAVRMADAAQIDAAKRLTLGAHAFELEPPSLPVKAPHFVAYTRAAADAQAETTQIQTTLDTGLQATVQALLDARVESLAPKNVHHGAVLVADHRTGEILAWAATGSDINAVTTPRQPGSALKPFLYALALEKGWTAATVIDDAPLTESVGGGLHAYQNYSRSFYGPVTLREALGNSLNIPALKTLQYVGLDAYLARLRALGFDGLTGNPRFYGDGLALGNGEVSLFELVQAYVALANAGIYRPLTTRLDDGKDRPARRVYSAEAASLIGNILSDPGARALEFGRHSVLHLPVQTAVKTGTSSDFRDAWTVGFNARHVVGVWMGNLDQEPTEGLTGSTGPALLLRAIFAELTRDEETRPLYLSPNLVQRQVCTGKNDCEGQTEWSIAGSSGDSIDDRTVEKAATEATPIRLSRPTQGLMLAHDPRLPPEYQAFEFFIEGLAPTDEVRWSISGRTVRARGGTYLWPVARGTQTVSADVYRSGVRVAEIDEVSFTVR